MQNYIEKANLSILNGILSGTMYFQPGLNLIGGENGTLKTKLLQALRSGAAVSSRPTALRFQSINPKRNSARRAVQQILQEFRQQNRTFDTELHQRIQAQIDDSGFINYPGLGDLYYLVYEHRAKDGGNRVDHMGLVANEFNAVIQSIFSNYRLVAEWDTSLGAPKIAMTKNNQPEFPVEALSLGEQEILGLVASINSNLEHVDVYLIDEPEVHLNWHLEEKLFAFLDDLCERHKRQAIVVTHSRAMFTSRYLPKSQFLYWSDSKIRWGKQLTPEQRKRIAGEAIEIIRLGEFNKATFFVEDSAHERLVAALAKAMDVAVTISPCGDSPNVKSLFKLSQKDGGWNNSYFLIDGDNQGNPFPRESGFIHLPLYCSDNYLLDPELLAEIFEVRVAEVKDMLRDSIIERRLQFVKKNKWFEFFEFLINQMSANELTYERIGVLDGSEILEPVARRLGSSSEEITARVVEYLNKNGRLGKHFPSALVDAIRGAEIVRKEGI